MKRIDQICGLAVICVESGANIGKVTQVILDAQSKKAAGLRISPKSPIGSARYIALTDVEIIGDVSVLVKPGAASKPVDRNQRRSNGTMVLGEKVYLTDGSGIGWFTNALIDEASGNIHSLEVSEGYFDDFLKGRRWINEFSCGDSGITALQNGRGQ